MSKDEIQTWMLLAFFLALFFSFYKVYLMFNKPGEGLDTTTQKDELIDIVEKALRASEKDEFDISIVYEKIVNEDLDWERHKNFNLNRFNQTVHTLCVIHEVQSVEDLLKKLLQEP
jgi:hypothetical protein